MKENHKKKIRIKIGNVFQIALPNGKYAYGRIYNDAAVGIYRAVSDGPFMPPIGSRDFLFNVGMYDDVLKSGECPIVGHDEFTNGESEWPPPHYIKDIITGEFSIYYKGKIRKSSKNECDGLEETAVWGLEHIIPRIMQELFSE
jgi:hypothetical protein